MPDPADVYTLQDVLDALDAGGFKLREQTATSLVVERRGHDYVLPLPDVDGLYPRGLIDTLFANHWIPRPILDR